MELLHTAKWNICVKELAFGTTFTRSDHGRGYDTSMDIPGLYFMVNSGDHPANDPIIYIGMTVVSIKKRLARHKKSLKDPAFKGEHTGKMFVAQGIDLDTKMDLWYMPAESIGAKNKYDLAATESQFISLLKPKAFDQKLLK